MLGHLALKRAQYLCAPKLQALAKRPSAVLKIEESVRTRCAQTGTLSDPNFSALRGCSLTGHTGTAHALARASSFWLLGNLFYKALAAD